MIDPCERATPEAGAMAFSAPPLRTLRRWFDSSAPAQDEETAERIDWLRAVPCIGMHISCLGIFFTGVSPMASIVQERRLRIGGRAFHTLWTSARLTVANCVR